MPIRLPKFLERVIAAVQDIFSKPSKEKEIKWKVKEYESIVTAGKILCEELEDLSKTFAKCMANLSELSDAKIHEELWNQFWEDIEKFCESDNDVETLRSLFEREYITDFEVFEEADVWAELNLKSYQKDLCTQSLHKLRQQKEAKKQKWVKALELAFFIEKHMEPQIQQQAAVLSSLLESVSEEPKNSWEAFWKRAKEGLNRCKTHDIRYSVQISLEIMNSVLNSIKLHPSLTQFMLEHKGKLKEEDITELDELLAEYKLDKEALQLQKSIEVRCQVNVMEISSKGKSFVMRLISANEANSSFNDCHTASGETVWFYRWTCIADKPHWEWSLNGTHWMSVDMLVVSHGNQTGQNPEMENQLIISFVCAHLVTTHEC